MIYFYCVLSGTRVYAEIMIITTENRAYIVYDKPQVIIITSG